MSSWLLKNREDMFLWYHGDVFSRSNSPIIQLRVTRRVAKELSSNKDENAGMVQRVITGFAISLQISNSYISYATLQS